MEAPRGERKSVKRAGLEISGSINLWNETERVQQRRARTCARGSIQMCCYRRDVSLVINHRDTSVMEDTRLHLDGPGLGSMKDFT